MIQLTKDTKVKLLRSIKTGQFIGADYPELTTEFTKIEYIVPNEETEKQRVKKANDNTE